MSLINNLRQQALNKQAQEEALAQQQAELRDYYRQHTQPVLIRLYRNLHELATHLNYLDQDLWVQYPLTLAGHQVPLRQAEYKIEIDSLENTENITFYGWCRGKLDLMYQIGDVAQLDKHIEYFKHYNIKFQNRNHINDKHQTVGSDITVKTELPIRLNFQADIANRCIKLTLTNLPVLGSTVLRLRPEGINDNFIDNLGHFILREKDDFLRLDISSAEKEHIRFLVEQEQRRRELEMRINMDRSS